MNGRPIISDLEAIKAIDRLAFAWSRNPDVIALKPWIAAHCGLNPHAAGPLDPDPALVAECDRLRAKVADLQDKVAASAARLQVADAKLGDARTRARVARNEAKTARKARLQAVKSDQTELTPIEQAAKDRRKAYMRELMRSKRAAKRRGDQSGPIADNAATPADGNAADG